MPSADVLALLAAALDGHNPRIVKKGNRLTLNPDGGRSDLDLLVDEMLFHDVPGTSIRSPRVHPQHAVTEVARGAAAVMLATAEALGSDPFTVDRAAVAEHLRGTVRAIREQEAGHDGEPS